MTLTPLLSAPPIIAVHTIAALAALTLGAWQMVGAKGTGRHRAVGYLWVALMVLVPVSSFFIHTIDQLGGFSAIHLLSILTLALLPPGIIAAHRHDVARHRRRMTALYLLALVITGLFTLLPGRIMNQVIFGV